MAEHEEAALQRREERKQMLKAIKRLEQAQAARAWDKWCDVVAWERDQEAEMRRLQEMQELAVRRPVSPLAAN